MESTVLWEHSNTFFGFNGATAFRRWKAAVDWIGTRAGAGFNGATAFRRWKALSVLIFGAQSMMKSNYYRANLRNQYPLHVWLPRILRFVPVGLREV